MKIKLYYMFILLVALIIIGVPWIIFGWLGMVPEHDFWIEIAGAIFMVLFFGYAGAMLFQYIAKSKEVTADTLFGAAYIYMFIGLSWTGVYTLVETARPLSFQISSDPPYQITRVSELIYFSFTTLTTLGYGDISPATSMA